MIRQRSYEIREEKIAGRVRYLTILRIDGYWFGTRVAKNRRSAKRKGEDHLASRRGWDKWHEKREAKRNGPGKARVLGIPSFLTH